MKTSIYIGDVHVFAEHASDAAAAVVGPGAAAPARARVAGRAGRADGARAPPPPAGTQ